MSVKKFLLLINIFLTGLILWMATNIFLTWASSKQWKSPLQTKDLHAKGSSETFSNNQKKLKDFETVIKNDIFHTTKKVSKTSVKKEKGIKFTDLNLKLKGTVVGENNKSYAFILDGSTNKEDLYYLNNFVQGARIVKIMSDRVILNLGGREEVLVITDERSEKKQVVQPKRRYEKKRRRPSRRVRKRPPRIPTRIRRHPVI